MQLTKRLLVFVLSCLVSMVSYAETLQHETAPSDAHQAVTKSDYSLGVGDLVRISVYGSPDLLTEARLSAEGTITFPLLGEVDLGGLSPKAAETKLANLLVKGGYIKYPQVNLVVEQYQSYSVSVLGGVFKPGKYALEKPSKLSEVLALAGGASPNGSDIVSVIRTVNNQSEKKEYDLREILDDAGEENNPVIKAGDIVYINAREVSVLGRVNRPGKYSVTSGVRTVLDFIAQAGGVAADGSDVVVVMTKRNGKVSKQEVDVDLLFKGGNQSQNVELTSGDSIYVPKMPVFYIYGEVQRPGSFRLERNMTVAQALSMGGGLTAKGSRRGITVKRNIKGKLKKIDVHLDDQLMPDDILYISESWF